jgi:hypothetical protein
MSGKGKPIDDARQNIDHEMRPGIPAVSHSQERQLNKAERWALSFHLLICRVCRKCRKQLAFMRNVLSRLKEPELYFEYGSSYVDRKHSEELRQRISKRTRENLDSK